LAVVLCHALVLIVAGDAVLVEAVVPAIDIVAALGPAKDAGAGALAALQAGIAAVVLANALGIAGHGGAGIAGRVAVVDVAAGVDGAAHAGIAILGTKATPYAELTTATVDDLTATGGKVEAAGDAHLVVVVAGDRVTVAGVGRGIAEASVELGALVVGATSSGVDAEDRDDVAGVDPAAPLTVGATGVVAALAAAFW
jgi:hypothetical protein